MTEQPTAPPPPPPYYPPPPAASGKQPNVPMIVLAYLWLLALIPLLVEKDDPEVQWHAKHGLVLFGLEIAIGIVLGILSTVVACLGCIIQVVLWIPIVIVHVMCIVKGIKGERLIIPGISELANKF